MLLTSRYVIFNENPSGIVTPFQAEVLELTAPFRVPATLSSDESKPMSDLQVLVRRHSVPMSRDYMKLIYGVRIIQEPPSVEART